MGAEVILAGILIGVAIAAPIGPINLIVLRNSLRRGFQAGVLTGLGSVLGDGLFASVAAFGVRQIEEFMETHSVALGVVGGLILVAAGIKTSRSHVDLQALAGEVMPLTGATISRKMASTFILTVTNPATLMGMVAIFGTMGVALRLTSQPSRAALAVAGVMLGSFVWWVFVSGLVTGLRNHLTGPWIDRLNRWSGILIAACGLFFLMNALAPYAPATAWSG